jgi:hypothetical protein
MPLKSARKSFLCVTLLLCVCLFSEEGFQLDQYNSCAHKYSEALKDHNHSSIAGVLHNLLKKEAA